MTQELHIVRLRRPQVAVAVLRRQARQLEAMGARNLALAQVA